MYTPHVFLVFGDIRRGSMKSLASGVMGDYKTPLCGLEPSLRVLQEQQVFLTLEQPLWPFINIFLTLNFAPLINPCIQLVRIECIFLLIILHVLKLDLKSSIHTECPCQTIPKLLLIPLVEKKTIVTM